MTYGSILLYFCYFKDSYAESGIFTEFYEEVEN